MGRRKLREYAFYIIFSLPFTKYTAKEALNNINSVIDKDELEPENLKYIEQTVLGVEENLEKIDSIIETYSKGYRLERISRAALAAMRLSIYEILFQKDVPENVSINEAVEIIKQFDSEESKKFSNGILGSFVRGREG
ncbi:transcription antitermination factor NusB [Acetivibrio sp. MSJd-27]|jgi:transcription antitermination factor nusB|uniref:transcription antitermination factor NusB n=1 Tax=Acetivibrio sp. MSJd-27 TaxID=2841523 RepID=UPI001C1050AF|nr:transcription antitermination factor NusB [Acetivibrio sp. MSJd-27]MBU5449689.1 transcription antitermination factor NusB [Acetivibrio sp. MSJd-27]